MKKNNFKYFPKGIFEVVDIYPQYIRNRMKIPHIEGLAHVYYISKKIDIRGIPWRLPLVGDPKPVTTPYFQGAWDYDDGKQVSFPFISVTEHKIDMVREMQACINKEVKKWIGKNPDLSGFLTYSDWNKKKKKS